VAFDIVHQLSRERHGHKPGPIDVSTKIRGLNFYAVPNFYYFEGCERPCWLPFYHRPQRNDDLGMGFAVTKNWPYENYSELPLPDIEPRWETSPPRGDSVLVIGQVRGQRTRNEIRRHSRLWNVALIPLDKATPSGLELCQRQSLLGQEFLIAYAPDLWLGNTGRHGIPYRPAPATG